MSDEQEINSSVTPPGSSESFDDFKSRIMDTMTGIASSMEGNTVVLTHSKPIGVMNGWEHAGYPEDGSIHMPTYEEGRERKPGNHEEIQIPKAVQDASYAARMPADAPKESKPYGYSDLAKDALGMLLPPPTRMYNIGTSNIKPPQAPKTPEDIQSSVTQMGMFGGKSLIKTSPEVSAKFDKAMEMSSRVPLQVGAAEKQALDIFNKTGWYQDQIDNQWKYFIPNKDSKIMTDNLETKTVDNPTGWTSLLNHGEKIHSIPEIGVPLQDVMQHPELYKAYPWLKDVTVKPITEGESYRGQRLWDEDGHPVIKVAKGSASEIQEVIHHEVQHIIQDHEGFPRGGSSKKGDWYDYARLSGEVEARNSSYWANTRNHNTNITPNDTMGRLGVPVEDIRTSSFVDKFKGMKGRVPDDMLDQWRKKLDERKAQGIESREAYPNRPITLEELSDMIHNKGMTQRDIAKDFGVSQAYINKQTADFNIKTKYTSGPRADLDLPGKIRDMLDEGKRVTDIAKELGISQGHVSFIKRKLSK